MNGGADEILIMNFRFPGSSIAHKRCLKGIKKRIVQPGHNAWRVKKLNRTGQELLQMELCNRLIMRPSQGGGGGGGYLFP